MYEFEQSIVAPVSAVPVESVTAQIPVSLNVIKSQVNALTKLVTASQWEKAAIVWAWVKPGSVNNEGAAKNPSKMMGFLTASGFAKLEIVGLKSFNTVLFYHSMWQYGIDNGFCKPCAPGQLVVLPDVVKYDWDGVKDLLTNGPASVKVPAAPKADQTWAFTWKPGDGVTIDETNVAELTKLYLTLKVEFEKLADIEFVVENKVTAKKFPGFATEPCAECGVPAAMITNTSDKPKGLPLSFGWVSAQTGHKDGCTKALPQVH